MRRLAAAAAVACLAVAGGCGGDGAETATETTSPSHSHSETAEAPPSETPSQTPAEPTPSDPGPDVKVIEITIKGDSVTPNAERVPVDVGQPIELQVTADAPGEIHVHSSPEQELAYDAGSTTLKLKIERPGVVDVEDHHLGLVIVQLEVS